MNSKSVKVVDYMARNPVTFTPATPLYEAMSRMLEVGISGAPVVSDTGQLLGVLSEIDFLAAMLKGSYHGQLEGTVADVMTVGAQSVTTETDIYEVSEIFLRDKRRRLTVLDAEDRLVGQISRRDVLRAIRDWSASS